MGIMISETFWHNRPILVTGATGLVGGHLVEAILNLQCDVVCLVRDWVPDSVLLKDYADQVKIVHGDICDQAVIERVLGEYEIKTVFHLAAQTIVTIANRNPVSTFESNIRGTWVLLEACRRSPSVEQIIMASSDKAYGTHTELPYQETTPLQGIYPYDVSKSCADLIAQSYAQSFGVNVVITRCGNFFGAGDLNWNRIIPGTIRSLHYGEPPIIRSDGKFIRDYFYVKDGALAYILLAQQLAENPESRGEAYNFSLEIQMDVLNLVKRISDLMEIDIQPTILNQVKNEIPHQYLDASKARQQLNWEPHYTLDEGLSETIAWYRQFLEGKHQRDS